jgi:hypothetical protein
VALWRRKALELLPELRDLIACAENVMALWIELRGAFEEGYRSDPPDASLITRIYSFVDWCIAAPPGHDGAHDAATAVVAAFYEHIPAFEPARDDMPRWFRYSEVAENRRTFSYHISDEAYEALLRHMKANEQRFRPRVR